MDGLRVFFFNGNPNLMRHGGCQLVEAQSAQQADSGMRGLARYDRQCMVFGRLGFRQAIKSSRQALQPSGLGCVENLPTRKAELDQIADAQGAGAFETGLKVLILQNVNHCA